MPSKTLSLQTPVSVLQKHFPHFPISSVPPRVFGSIAFVHSHSIGQSKLSSWAHKCVFIGYSPTQKGYKCYSPILKRVFVSKDVSFFESGPYFTSSSNQGLNLGDNESLSSLCEPENGPTLPYVGSDQQVTPLPHVLEYESVVPHVGCDQQVTPSPYVSQTLNETDQNVISQPLKVYSRRHLTRQDNPLPTQLCQESNPNECSRNPTDTGDTLNSATETVPKDLPIALRKGTRTCTMHPISRFVSYKKLSPTYSAFITNLSESEIPRDVHEALKKPGWKEAVLEEMKALKENHTWDLTELPTRKKAVGCKWIFTIKYNSDGSLNRYKARLVAQGFTQT